jgi:diadenosine tetraphosphatase ApaH/serine/threonine PP2A family protein phosphatase
LDLEALFEESCNASATKYATLIGRAIDAFKNENGKIGNLTIEGRLVTLQACGQAVVVGDLHGDIVSLHDILEKSNIITRMEQSKDVSLIFLGDYGDRGRHSAEIYYVILSLKQEFPSQVILLRGNHEAPGRLLGMPHDLPHHFKSRFDFHWQMVYDETVKLWRCFYNAVYVPERFLMVHGGVSDIVNSLEDIATALFDDSEVLEDLLWSDPEDDLHGISPSFRGAGKVFGKDITENVLRKLHAKVLIRGHEASEKGYKISHDGRVLTLFSRKGSPYFNKGAAYLDLLLNKKYDDTSEIEAYIQTF